MKILGIDTNSKTVKGQKKGYLTGICYLAPADESGVINVCPNASAGCKAACLFTAGRGRMSNVKDARVNKTLAFVNDKNAWFNQLRGEITALVKKAEKSKMIPCVRLNGTSDIAWERVRHENKNIMEYFPNVQFYDYTKSLCRMLSKFRGEMPANYHLTFSRSECNDAEVSIVLENGGNVAVVFSGKLPNTYKGKRVINGDESDLRFLDDENVIVGLSSKGQAKKDKSGFVVTT
jgi:hypothetical protein